MIPNRRGVFQGMIHEIGVSETGPNKLVTVIIKLAIGEEMIAGEAQDVTNESLDITGYFYVEKKDGTLNENTIKSLKAALGWDGRDVMALQNDPKFTNVQIQAVLDYETYTPPGGQPKETLKWKFLNPYGADGGGVKRADADAAKHIAGKLGAKLRAVAGAASPAAKQPVTGSSGPAKRTGRPGPGAVATATAPAPGMSADQAWAAFAAKRPGVAQEAMEKEWFALLGPGRDVKLMTAAEWQKFTDADAVPAIPKADIPF